MSLSFRHPRLLERGLLCLLIGAAVLIAPYLLQGTRWFEMVAGAHLVGWFALLLGVALVGVHLAQRARAQR